MFELSLVVFGCNHAVFDDEDVYTVQYICDTGVVVLIKKKFPVSTVIILKNLMKNNDNHTRKL